MSANRKTSEAAHAAEQPPVVLSNTVRVEHIGVPGRDASSATAKPRSRAEEAAWVATIVGTIIALSAAIAAFLPNRGGAGADAGQESQGTRTPRMRMLRVGRAPERPAPDAADPNGSECGKQLTTLRTFPVEDAQGVLVAEAQIRYGRRCGLVWARLHQVLRGPWRGMVQFLFERGKMKFLETKPNNATYVVSNGYRVPRAGCLYVEVSVALSPHEVTPFVRTPCIAHG